ncbi:MAG: putative cytosolic protein [uncultured bacterium]|nr:MAG: putative cytosolic protein [uncultured bacterium]
MEIANSVYQQMYDLTESDLSKSIFEFSAQNAAQLPRLPYATNQFDLALCTDFIFHHGLPSEDIASTVKELCRIASEVRLFPLLDNQGKMSNELGPLMLMLQKKNYGVEVREVPDQTGKGRNAMLRIWEQECRL